MIRAVLDTNVILSGMISPRGRPAAILDAWRAGYFQHVTCPDILVEVAEKLRIPKIRNRYCISDSEADTILARMSAASNVLVPGTTPIEPSPPDPDDRMLFSAAVEAAADFIVTGDRPLQSFAWPGPAKIVSPNAFWRELHSLKSFSIQYPVYGLEDDPGARFVFSVIEDVAAVAIFTSITHAGLYRRNNNMAARLAPILSPSKLADHLRRVAQTGILHMALNPIGAHSLVIPIDSALASLEQL